MKIQDDDFRVITGILFAIAIEGAIVLGYLVYRWLS